MPFDPPGFNTHDYVKTVSEGVYENLMRADKAVVPIAGSMFPKSQSDIRWVWEQPRCNRCVRWAVYVVIKTLRRSLDFVTFDRTAFEEAVKEVPEGARIVLVP